MKTTLKLLVVTLLSCLSAAALTAPGSAAPAVEWADPAGDANGLPEVESTPRPSDPELDVLNVTFNRRGDSLVASLRLERLGIAPGSFGSVYRWYFTLKDAEYYFMARSATPEYDQLYYSTPAFYQVDPLGVEDVELRCDCKAIFDSKTNTVSFAIKWDGIKKTIKGGELTNLYALTFRRYSLFIDADTARAPEKASFTL